MGSLFWQFNDLWPVFSWSSVDYYGQWKALHYVARHFYDNLVLSVQLVRDDIPYSKREFFRLKHANYIKLEVGGRNGGQPAVVEENFSYENGKLLPSNN